MGYQYDTSLPAYILADTVAQDVKVVFALGQMDHTYDELIQLTDGLPQSMSATCNRLMKDGVIERTGEKRATRYGRLAAVWRLVKA
jgi:hypothetical protein